MLLKDKGIDKWTLCVCVCESFKESDIENHGLQQNKKNPICETATILF